MSGYAHVRNGSIATGPSQRQVRPCPLCVEEGNNFRELATPRRAVRVDGTAVDVIQVPKRVGIIDVQKRVCAAPTIRPSRCLESWARGACHRARIRATRWLCTPYASLPRAKQQAG